MAAYCTMLFHCFNYYAAATAFTDHPLDTLLQGIVKPSIRMDVVGPAEPMASPGLRAVPIDDGSFRSKGKAFLSDRLTKR